MVSVTPRAIVKLQEMQKEGPSGHVFRVVFKGFG